ncbi:uncharacterized protein [Montipora foliosa]
MAQVPIAPLAADIQAVLRDPPPQPDAQPDAPAVQPVALQADGPQPPPGNQLAAVQPAAEAPAQGAAQPASLPELDLQTLSSKVDTLQKQLATNSVEHVRQLAGRPSPLIDNHSLLAALEQLADVARQTGHTEKKKYNAIFRQCKPLLRDGRLASVVTRLLGDPVEKQVASQIQKILKSGTASQPLPPGPRATLMHRRDSDILAHCWILHETEGCLVEGLTLIAIAVSNVAIWGILLAIAQDVFLSYCVINFSAP